ncbi:MAG: hypothetical protein IJ626_01800 [Muribaculaceae bacterium]|nr:hypothetical protein [Muribaculaceae bacterium]
MRKNFIERIRTVAVILALVLGFLRASADNPTTMFILGNVNQYTDDDWNPLKGVAMDYNSETEKFTATVYCQKDINYFSFATELNDWNSLNDGNKRYGSENGDWDAHEDLTDDLDSPVAIKQGSQSSFYLPAGVYSITLDVPNLKLTVSKKALQVTTYPINESVKQGTVITAKSNLTSFVEATGSGETVTVQVKLAADDYKNSVTLSEKGVVIVRARASIGKLVVENTMGYNVIGRSALDDKTYTWVDAAGETQTSSYTDVATDPQQIMGLLNAIYTDPDVPGVIQHREYKPDGTPWDESSQTSETEVNYEAHSRQKYTWNSTSKTRTGLGARAPWIKCNGTVPQPNVDGATVLFIQIKDSWKAEDIDAYYSGGAMSNASAAEQTLQLITDAYESVQVITNQMRVEDANNPGTMLMIDNVTTSRFYFISKGRVRAGGGSAPLYLAYEQLSPVQTNPGADMSDALNSGGVYNFVHDCHNVFRGDMGSGAYAGKYIPHYAQISGFNSSDLNDMEAKSFSNLTLYLPDKRFKRPDNVSSRSQGFLYNYSGDENQATSPKLLLYKAHLAAKGTPSSTGYYDIKLDWSTWFDADEIKANVTEHFFVYAIDQDGNKMLLNEFIEANGDYELIDGNELPSPTTDRTYTFRVKQLQDRQTFDFIVIANPENSEMFVKTNVAKVVIPGQDKFFLDGQEYRSRYSLENECNIYKNKLRIYPNHDFSQIDCTPGHYEIYRIPAGGEQQKIASISFSKSGMSYNYTIAYEASTQNTSLTYDNSTVPTNGTLLESGYMEIVDRFTASTETNDHPESYTYFMGYDGGAGSSSNTYVVPVYKTDNHVTLGGFTLSEIEGDTNHDLEEDKEVVISFHALMDLQQSIDRYDVHRVHSEDYHTHIGKVKHTIGNSMSVIGVNHGSGHMSEDLGTIDTKEAALVKVYDDLEYCPSAEPDYVTEIYTRATAFNGQEVENHYGSAIASIQVPELKVEVLEKVRTEPQSIFMGYSAKLQLEPELVNPASHVYLYRTWRVEDDGSETLLNTLGRDYEGVTTYGADYDALFDTWPGNETTTINDVYYGRAFPREKTETVEVEEYDENGDPTGVTRQEVVTIGGQRDVEYIVRMYSTRLDPSVVGAAPRRKAPSTDGAFYVTEKRVTVPYDYHNTMTDIEEANVGEIPVVRTVYYNIQGMQSETPFRGFNVVARTLANGAVIYEKVILKK